LQTSVWTLAAIRSFTPSPATARRKWELGFFYRNPENRGGVFTSGANQLFFDQTPGTGTTCPTIPRGVNATTKVTSSVAARNAGLADPTCFTFLEWFPGGYTPDFGGKNVDMSNVTGLRGELNDGTTYDLSLGNGFSEMTYMISNTTNPSMGPNSPTSFEPGIYTTIENNINLDLSKPFDVGLYSPLNVAYGLEWRREIFKVGSEDQDSYRIGEYSNLGAGVGSDGFQGFGPDQQGTWDRKNWAIYADLEVDVTEQLLLGAAIRYEDFYNTFGGTTNGKLTARYALTESTNIRSTVSTGLPRAVTGSGQHLQHQHWCCGQHPCDTGPDSSDQPDLSTVRRQGTDSGRVHQLQHRCSDRIRRS
jgi:iron complex outermembrane receptor protein